MRLFWYYNPGTKPYLTDIPQNICEWTQQLHFKNDAFVVISLSYVQWLLYLQENDY